MIDRDDGTGGKKNCRTDNWKKELRIMSKTAFIGTRKTVLVEWAYENNDRKLF